MKEFTFTAWCRFGKGDSGETWIDVELTDEEAERLIKYGTQGDIYYNEFCRCKELEDLYKKIYAIAIDQITEELRDVEDDARDPKWKADDTYACGVNFPNEFEDILIEEEERIMKERTEESVVIYVRESNHSGAEEFLEKQKERLKAFCEQNNYVVADEVATIGNRADSMAALKQAIEYAKNTEGKTLLMASSNRVVGTISEMETVANLIDESGVTIKTMDGSYEFVKKFGTSPEMLIANTLAATEDEFDEEGEDEETL